MRIVSLCLDRGAPLGGPKGCSIHQRAVIGALLDAGHSVDAVVVSSGPEESYRPLKERGLRVRQLAAPVERREIAEHLAAAGAECVIERLSLLASEGAAAAAGMGITHVYEVNAPLDREAAEHRGLVGQEQARETFASGFALSRGAVAVSEEVAEWVRDLAPAGYAVEIVPNGFDASFLTPVDPAAIERVRQELGIEHGRFRIGFAGAFRPWHDVDTLIHAVARLGSRRPSTLVLIGDGPERARWANLANSLGVSVAFTGQVPHSAVRTYLALCDCMVVPYAHSDGYFSPLKLVEAMSAGKAVVASATGPCRRVIRDQETGLLATPGEAESLERALERVASDVTLRDRLGRAARVAVAGQTWDHVVVRVLEFASRVSHPSAGVSDAHPEPFADCERAPVAPLRHPVVAGSFASTLRDLLDPVTRHRTWGPARERSVSAVWPEGSGAMVRLEDGSGKPERSAWLRIADDIEAWEFPRDPALSSLAALWASGRYSLAGHRLGRRAALRARDGSGFLHLRRPGSYLETHARLVHVHQALHNAGVGTPQTLDLAPALHGWRAVTVCGTAIGTAGVGPGAWELLGRRLARVHATPCPAGLPEGGEARARAAAERQIGLVIRAETPFGQWLENTFGSWVPPRAPEAAPTPDSLIHGDLHPAQILVGEGITILDWEWAKRGDPEEDLGNLAAHLYWGSGSEGRAAWDEFKRGYQAEGGRLLAKRFATYARGSLLRILAIHSWRDQGRARCLEVGRWQEWEATCLSW